ncbi:hypothetical protein A0H81_06194 [Grifola frondosa]|uniref:Uncharacterized protein n=1 Tax=Grifola frondosa TaxID=5627 RepID=A0A1C7MFL9_GRIFR|nr:hypothetical protein A0H81_06194 [Grifola frondosa]
MGKLTARVKSVRGKMLSFANTLKPSRRSLKNLKASHTTLKFSHERPCVNLLFLNEDIWAIIISLLSSVDASHFSQTCRDAVLLHLPPHQNYLPNLRKLVLTLEPMHIALDDLFSAISQFKRLESLSLTQFYSWIIPPRRSVAGLEMPSVRELHVADGYLPMRLMVELFPNVRSLSFSGFEFDELYFFDPIPRWPESVDTCWPCLDYVKTTDVDLLSWKLTCPIRWLNLMSVGRHIEDINRVLNFIKKTSPQVLSFTARAYDIESAFWPRLTRDAPQLRYIEVDLLENTDLTRAMSTWATDAFSYWTCGSVPVPAVALHICLRPYFPADVMRDHRILVQLFVFGAKALRTKLVNLLTESAVRARWPLRYLGISIVLSAQPPVWDVFAPKAVDVHVAETEWWSVEERGRRPMKKVTGVDVRGLVLLILLI